LIEGGFDWADARDVAAAAIQAATRAPLGAKYLFSGHYASVRDLAEIVHEITGYPVPRLTAPTWLARSGAPALAALNRLTRGRQLVTPAALHALSACNRQISHARATRDLDYQPRPLQETIRDTLRWFQEAGLIK
jgi:dihydroflavonol-4-reductase